MKTVQVSLRLSADFLKKIDQIAVRMSTPGVVVTRGAAIRHAAHLGVEQLDTQEKEKQSKKAKA